MVKGRLSWIPTTTVPGTTSRPEVGRLFLGGPLFSGLGGYSETVPIDMELQILTVLQGMNASGRPATFGDLARRFGVSSDLIALHAKQLVAEGRAQPSMVNVRGVPTLHGLMPKPDPGKA